MKIPFVGPAYQARSLNADAQRAINVYLEMDNKSPRAPVALYGMPGTVVRFTLDKAPVRGFLQQGSYLYAVAGAGVYRVDSNYNATPLGSIGTGVGPVSMASNGSEVLIVDGLNGWLATSSALTQITDTEFPNGVTQCGYISSYFVVAGDGSGRIYWSETPNSGADWNGLDFATAEGDPDNTIALIVNQLEVWLLGPNSGEIFILTGDADAPFQRSGNTFIERGIAASGTLAKIDNTVMWLSSDARGGATVSRADGYSPNRNSQHALERAMQSYGDVSDAFAYTFQMEGHLWYVLTFPAADKTWFFDVASGEWFEWAWRDPASGDLHRHRSNCHVYFNGEHLVGDWEDGRVYALDMDTYTDDEDPILRLRATQCMDSPNGKRMFYEELIVDMETGLGDGAGSDPLLMMRYSNNGAHSWSNTKYKSAGKAGEYGKQVKFGPTGSGRNRVWEISMTDNAKFAVTGAYLRATEGT